MSGSDSGPHELQMALWARVVSMADVKDDSRCGFCGGDGNGQGLGRIWVEDEGAWPICLDCALRDLSTPAA